MGSLQWLEQAFGGSRDAESLRGRTVGTDAPIDGDVLTWNEAAGRWQPGTPAPAAAGGGIVPVASCRVDAGAPPTWETYKSPIGCYSFADGATNTVHVAVPIPAGVAAAGGLIISVDWAPSTGAAGGVRWALDYSIAQPGSAFGAATRLLSTGATHSQADRHEVTQFASIAPSGLPAGSVMLLALSRLGAAAEDTYGAKVWGMGIGIGLGIFAPPASPGYLDTSFAAAGPYSALVSYARTGNAVQAAQTAATTASVAANTAIWEDRGDGYGGGLWSFPAYSNTLSQPGDLTNAAWSKSGTPTITLAAATAPDGTNTAQRFQDSNAAAHLAAYQSLTQTGYYTVWVKTHSGDVPGTAGMLSPVSTAASGWSTGLSSTWARIGGYRASGNIYALWGPGSQPGPVWTDAATGSFDFAYPMRSSIAADVPFLDGAAGATTISVDPTLFVDSGDLDVEIDWIQAYVDGLALPDFYVFRATSADGEMSLRFTSSTDTWTLRVRGADVLTCPASSGSATNTNQNGALNDFHRWRIWYRPSTGAMGLRSTVNGVVSVDKTGATSGGALAAPTVAYLGSNAGASGLGGRFRLLRKNYTGFAPTTPNVEIVVLGDSTVASYNKYRSSAADYYTTAQRDSRAGIGLLALGGDTIAGQKAKWLASAWSSASSVVAVVVEVGLNDCTNVSVAATVIAAYQDLINTIKASRPTAKIIVATMSPAKQRYTDVYGAGGANAYSCWQALNTAISGGGGTPITGVDARVTSHTAALNDGSDNLASTFDVGDHIHPNNAGRSVISAAHKAALVAQGVLP